MISHIAAALLAAQAVTGAVIKRHGGYPYGYNTTTMSYPTAITNTTLRSVLSTLQNSNLPVAESTSHNGTAEPIFTITGSIPVVPTFTPTQSASSLPVRYSGPDVLPTPASEGNGYLNGELEPTLSVTLLEGDYYEESPSYTVPLGIQSSIISTPASVPSEYPFSDEPEQNPSSSAQGEPQESVEPSSSGRDVIPTPAPRLSSPIVEELVRPSSSEPNSLPTSVPEFSGYPVEETKSILSLTSERTFYTVPTGVETSASVSSPESSVEIAIPYSLLEPNATSSLPGFSYPASTAEEPFSGSIVIATISTSPIATPTTPESIRAESSLLTLVPLTPSNASGALTLRKPPYSSGYATAPLPFPVTNSTAAPFDTSSTATKTSYGYGPSNSMSITGVLIPTASANSSSLTSPISSGILSSTTEGYSIVTPSSMTNPAVVVVPIETTTIGYLAGSAVEETPAPQQYKRDTLSHELHTTAISISAAAQIF
ncbi:hypothetical protein N0V90_003220 [Kalmusia sp. IMI 367209]|nr:hypothetical protein N0V90_003220 [Kalmusia sp. IMI 367209]